MATTAMTIRSNRIRDRALLAGTVTSVAVDTQISEDFTLPAQFGDFWLETIQMTVQSLSADLVDPSYPSMQNGFNARVVVAATAALGDHIAGTPFVAWGGTEARPLLVSYAELYRFCLIRQDERIQVVGPVLAGAGATATIGITVRGIRMRQA